MKKIRKTLNTGGFSLVELLIALAILGIIVVPLLHAFTTSAATAAKSRRVGNATLAARNAAEAVEATDLSAYSDSNGPALLGSLFGAQSAAFYQKSGGGYAPLSGLPSGTKEYCVGLRGLTAGGDTFDAMLTLDADPYSVTNATMVTQYTPMDAVFSQPDGSADPDAIAAADFANQATTLTGADYSAASFEDAMDRQIDVAAKENDAKTELTVTADFTYSYTLNYTADETAVDGTVTPVAKSALLTKDLSYEFYRGACDAGVPGIHSIYVFFYPTYASGTGYDDVITIDNPDDLALSFFLIKQKTAGCESREPGYSAMVKLRESAASVGANASVYSNIGRNVATGGSLVGPFYYRIYHGEVWYKKGALTGDLVAVSQTDRMYGVNVLVYSPGADFSGDKPIFELDSSKLD